MAAPGELTISYASLPPLVFQCAGCRRVVGDSTEIICTATCGTLRLVVLQAASGVEVDQCAVLSAELGAEGRHFAVCCSGCGSVVGRLYSGLAGQGTQDLVNSFCLDASRCTSYELGSSEIRVDQQQRRRHRQDDGEAQGGASITPLGAGPPSLAADAAFVELAARVELLQAELTRMQGMVLLHDSQLRQLPHYPPTPQGLPPPEQGPPPSQPLPGGGADAGSNGGWQGCDDAGLPAGLHLRTRMGAG